MQTPGQTLQVPGFALDSIARQIAGRKLAAETDGPPWSAGWAEGAEFVLEMLDIQLPEPPATVSVPAA